MRDRRRGPSLSPALAGSGPATDVLQHRKQENMTPRVPGALISTAVISGLLLSAAPAHATEMMPSSSSTQQADISGNDFPTPGPGNNPEPADSEAISEATATDTAEIPEKSSTDLVKDADQPQADMPSNQDVERDTETAAPQPAANTPAPEHASSPVPTSSPEPTQVPAPTDTATDIAEENAVAEEDGAEAAEASPSSEPSESSTAGHPDSTSLLTDWDEELTPEQEEILKKIEKLAPKGMDDWTDQQWEDFAKTEAGIEYDRLWKKYYETLPEWEDTLSEEERAFWEKIDQMLPEGSDNWGEARWEAFYATPEGQEIERLTNEFYEKYYEDDFGFELTPEEQAFFEELERRMPAGSDDWDDKQWEEYLMTDEGYQLLDFFLTFEFEQIETPEELNELIETYREWLDDGTGWFDDFVNQYLNGPDNEPTGQPEVPSAPRPGTNIGVEASEIAPVAKAVKVLAERSQHATHPAGKKMPAAKQDAAELAETGFNSLLLGASGVALSILGALAMRRKRKIAAK